MFTPTFAWVNSEVSILRWPAVDINVRYVEAQFILDIDSHSESSGPLGSQHCYLDYIRTPLRHKH